MRNIIITGGDDGLGKSLAKLLGSKESIITISKTQEAAFTISKEVPTAECYTCDITNPEEVAKTIDDIINNSGDIDILINNAGVWLAGDLVKNTYEQISDCLDVNVKGTIYVTKAVLANMYETGHGLIINICSQSCFENDNIPIYNTSEWALMGFTKSMQQNAGPKGIRITGFYPGYMQTDFFKKAGNNYETSSCLEVEKVAKAIEFIINTDEDIIIPEFGIKNINQ